MSYALQDFRWERDADGFVTIYGRIERINESTGKWETFADFSRNGICFPEILETMPPADQDAFLNDNAAKALMRIAGIPV
jgi:hypothetical protein